MLTCPSCGTASPDGFKFCPECAGSLAPPRAVSEERKIVTSLFCDLVGFTAASEKADPEDVDHVLRDYNAMARRVVESHGGTVEKFIGDAVLAVFGVPNAHEDDAERAVRAGLRIVQEAERVAGLGEGETLQLRVGINTGEALVRLDVEPGSGERFLIGDAVNVAARLQGIAPPPVAPKLLRRRETAPPRARPGRVLASESHWVHHASPCGERVENPGIRHIPRQHAEGVAGRG